MKGMCQSCWDMKGMCQSSWDMKGTCSELLEHERDVSFAGGSCSLSLFFKCNQYRAPVEEDVITNEASPEGARRVRVSAFTVINLNRSYGDCVTRLA